MIENFFLPMIDPLSILSAMKETLRTIDPQYPAEEDAYLHGIDALRHALPENHPIALDDVLDGDDRNMGANLLFIFWRGVKQNYDCFQNPVNKLFLQMDYEDFHQEYLLGNFIPEGHNDLGGKFALSLPADTKYLLDPITSYYTYMETTAYKLAHYYGYCFANHFLKKVISGYHSDVTTTSMYSLMLEKDLYLSNLVPSAL